MRYFFGVLVCVLKKNAAVAGDAEVVVVFITCLEL